MRSHGRWCAVSDELEVGPTALAPGAPAHNDALARWIVWPLVATFALIVIVFYLVFAPVYVDGDSMLNTLVPGDRLLRTKGYEQPVHDDVVVVSITTPDGVTEDLVKRVIALPGDTIEIRDDVAIVNGAREDTTHLLLAPGYGVNSPPVRVQQGQVYVMGDNRPVSLDSRYVGTLPLRRVRGKVVAIFTPVNRIGLVR